MCSPSRRAMRCWWREESSPPCRGRGEKVRGERDRRGPKGERGKDSGAPANPLRTRRPGLALDHEVEPAAGDPAREIRAFREMRLDGAHGIGGDELGHLAVVALHGGPAAAGEVDGIL